MGMFKAWEIFEAVNVLYGYETGLFCIAYKKNKLFIDKQYRI